MKLGILCSKSKENSRFKDAEREKMVILKNIIFLALGFTLIFTAFNSMTALQSSINREAGLGTASLTAVFVAFIISCIFCPSLMIRYLKVKWTMCSCALSYSIFVAAQFYPTFYTLIPTGLLVGFSAAPMWIAQSKYISKIATRYAELTNVKSEHILSKFFGIFFLFYQTSAVWGNIISSTVLKSANETQSLHGDLSVCGANYCPQKEMVSNATAKNFNVETWQIYALSSAYLIASFLAVILLTLTVDPLEWFISSDDANETKKTTQTGFELLTATLTHLKNPNQILIIPISIWSGLEKAFLSADFTAGYITCSWGVSKVGYVFICYGVGKSISSYFFGTIIKAFGSRIPIFIFGAVINASLIIAMFLWIPNPDESYMFFLLAVMWGVSSAIWQTQLSAFYGVMFQGQEEAAFSNFKLWESVGFVINYMYQNSICMEIKLYILSTFLFMGMVGYFLTEIRIKSYPPSKAKSTQEGGA